MKRLVSLIPIAGILIFLSIYFYAAAIYPGGTRFDHSSVGYSHIKNYWCDLMDAVSYSGQKNPGRQYALAGTILLPLTLIPFWLSVPILLKSQSKISTTIKLTGALAMGIAALMPLAHDLTINIASVLIVIAFVSTIIALYREKQYFLISIALIAILFCALNYTLWVTRYRLDLMPFIQKIAFISSFCWVILMSLASYTEFSVKRV